MAIDEENYVVQENIRGSRLLLFADWPEEIFLANQKWAIQPLLEHSVRVSAPGARFSKVPRTFRARKAIRKTQTCLFCKAGLFMCCKGYKNENTNEVSCLETPSF